MKKFILSIACLLAVSAASADEFIGKAVNEQLIEKISGQKLEWASGTIALDREQSSVGVTQYDAEKSPKMVIVLEDITNEGKNRILLDYFVIDKATIAKTAAFAIYQAPDKNDKPQPILIALYDESQMDKNGEQVEFYTRIYKAWSIDPQTVKFIEIPVKGLKFPNEAYYY